MTINITLFIQVIHFFIAYFIISKLLLNPAVRIIKDEELIEADLHSSILKKQFKIDEVVNKKKVIELKNIEEFLNIKPNIEIDFKEKISWSTIKPIPISTDLLETISKDISTYIIKKVKNLE